MGIYIYKRPRLGEGLGEPHTLQQVFEKTHFESIQCELYFKWEVLFPFLYDNKARYLIDIIAYSFLKSTLGEINAVHLSLGQVTYVKMVILESKYGSY